MKQTPLEHIKILRPNLDGSRLRGLLAGFGIGADQANTMVGKLSGGQKARLSILLATIDAPHLLILDEPTDGLDPNQKHQVRQMILDTLPQVSKKMGIKQS